MVANGDDSISVVFSATPRGVGVIFLDGFLATSSRRGGLPLKDVGQQEYIGCRGHCVAEYRASPRTDLVAAGGQRCSRLPTGGISCAVRKLRDVSTLAGKCAPALPQQAGGRFGFDFFTTPVRRRLRTE